jgi:Trp operon repressor
MANEPHFNELRKDILTLMKSDDSITLERAYARALAAKVPGLSSQRAAALQQKVGASSANPSRPSGAVSGPPKDFTEALERIYSSQ